MTELPPGEKAIGSKWVFKIKYNADGSIERYKVCLVAMGNRQVEGTDYSETFAPVVRMETIKTFMGVALARHWDIHQIDIHNVFHYGDLDEEDYMKPPPGFRTNNHNHVCCFKKSLYGLKRCLDAGLLSYGHLCWDMDFANLIVIIHYSLCEMIHRSYIFWYMSRTWLSVVIIWPLLNILNYI